MRFSYYLVREFHNPKPEFVDKFTHFVDEIGNFVNKTDRI